MLPALQRKLFTFSRLLGSGGSSLIGFIQSGAGAVPRTLQDKARERLTDTDYGATIAGVDSILEIQAAIDAQDVGAIGGAHIHLPGTANDSRGISNSIRIPARLSGDNHTRWYRISGSGRGAPRIVALAGMANKSMINANGVDLNTLSYYRELKDFYLNGAGIAKIGIDILFNQHFRLDNLFITGLDDGAGEAAGVRVYGAICGEILGLKVHNSDGHGLHSYGGSGNFFNAMLVSGGSMLDLSGDGIWITGGVNGCSFVGITLEFCRYGMRLAGYSGGSSMLSGSYLEANELADLYFGEVTTLQNFSVDAVYLNGYSAGISAPGYTPVLLKYGQRVSLRNVQVAQPVKSPTGYYLFDGNIAGGSITDSTIENPLVRGLATSTPPNEVYNLPANWTRNRNVIVDEIFAPFIPINVLRKRLPYGGWTLSLAGGSTIAKSDVSVAGGYGVRFTRGTDACQASMVIPVTPEMNNRFVSFVTPIIARVASKIFTISAIPNGTGAMPGVVSETTAVGELVFAGSLCFVPADATQITLVLDVASDAGDFDVGHPCPYVGARFWYSAGCDPHWEHTAAPIVGTWEDGDRVKNSAPAAGGSPGWVCTTPGAAGVFVFRAEANLA